MADDDEIKRLNAQLTENDKEIRRLKNQIAANHKAHDRLGDTFAEFRKALEGLLERFVCDDAVDYCVFAYAEGVVRTYYAARKAEAKEVQDAIQAIRSESDGLNKQ
jgi:hypothetical protein